MGLEAVFSGPIVASNTVQNGKVVLPIVAVRTEVSCSSDHVSTYALLDSGSACSFCTKELLDALKIEGHRESVAVFTLDGYSYTSRTAVLEVSGMYVQEGLLLIDVNAKDSLPGLMGHIGQRWTPNGGRISVVCPFPRPDHVGLIIGQDNSMVLAPVSTVVRRSSEPYVIRTCLSWSLHGVLSVAQRREISNACLVAAESGSSKVTVLRLHEVERGTKRPARPSSAHHRRSSSSAGLKCLADGRASTEGGKSQVSRAPVFPPLSLSLLAKPPLAARRNFQITNGSVELQSGVL